MTNAYSPLRYPGGKQILGHVLASLIDLNRRSIYIEPYAGGAGAALQLLFEERVERVIINDLDRGIYSFWHCVLRDTDAFLTLLESTPITLDEWTKQRSIYQDPAERSCLEVAFATFFLNRCNRSGIVANAGPIGGKHQNGTWRIDARFNKPELARRIMRLSAFRERIEVHNADAICFLRGLEQTDFARQMFVYLDPPYFAKGQNLYLNAYGPKEHSHVAEYLRREAQFAWVLTYDSVPEIRRLYRGLRQVPFALEYSARNYRTASELMIVGSRLRFPREWRAEIPKRYISAASGLQI